MKYPGAALRIKYEESAQTHALKNVLVRKPTSVVRTLSAANTNGQFWWSTRTHENVKSLVREIFTSLRTHGLVLMLPLISVTELSSFEKEI